MRLIDAERLMYSLRGNVLIDVTTELEETIAQQPTAFYKEKVIEELKAKAEDSRQCSELDAYKEIGTVEECQEAVEKLKRAEEALNVILSGNYNDECNFCVHNDNPMANCQCICGDGSWCIHNAKWNGKTSEDENLEGMEDENT